MSNTIGEGVILRAKTSREKISIRNFVYEKSEFETYSITISVYTFDHRLGLLVC